MASGELICLTEDELLQAVESAMTQYFCDTDEEIDEGIFDKIVDEAKVMFWKSGRKVIL